jgi:hypothetical protein
MFAPRALLMDLRGRRSGVRCVLSLCRAEALVAELLGLLSGAARGRAGRRDAAEIHQKGPSVGDVRVPLSLVGHTTAARAVEWGSDRTLRKRGGNGRVRKAVGGPLIIGC